MRNCLTDPVILRGTSYWTTMLSASRSRSRQRRAQRRQICRLLECPCGKSQYSIPSTDSCGCPWRRSASRQGPSPGTVGQYRLHIFEIINSFLKWVTSGIFTRSWCPALGVFMDWFGEGGECGNNNIGNLFNGTTRWWEFRQKKFRSTSAWNNEFIIIRPPYYVWAYCGSILSYPDDPLGIVMKCGIGCVVECKIICGWDDKDTKY